MKEYKPCLYPYSILRGRKAERGFENDDIAETSGHSASTVSRVLNGHEEIKLETLRDVAESLGLRVVIKFEEVKENEPLRLIERAA